jgi:hypothetical protein
MLVRRSHPHPGVVLEAAGVVHERKIGLMHVPTELDENVALYLHTHETNC